MDIWVYMLRCADGSYYVGLTREGLDKRIAEHRDGRFLGYTHGRRPVELVWSQDFQWLTDAIACERRLKGWRREKKEALIRGDFGMLPVLARTAKRPPPSTGSG
jgi:putative endonuclease